jgi:hypothetical protein
MSNSVPTTGTVSDVVAMGRIDEVERRLVEQFQADQAPTLGGTPDITPIKNHFTPGLYCREIFMPKGAVVTSRVHRYRHPFVVSAGECVVYAGGAPSIDSWQHITAPHFGITEPGTRRILVILEDTTWTTFHVTDKTDVEEIVKDILVDYENPLLNSGEVTQ